MKNENGVTLLALVITITVVAIIGFTVFFTAEGIDETVDDDILIAELKTVHHIVLQEYNKKLTLGDAYEYINKDAVLSTEDELDTYKTNLGITSFKTTFDKYYILTLEQLNSIDGVKNATSNYLVCYETGEVANISEYQTSAGEVLYTK